MRVLLIAARYPWPPRRGDQLRTLQWIEALAPRAQLVVLVPRPSAGAPVPPPRRGVTFEHYPAPLVPAASALRRVAAGEPLQTALFSSTRLAAAAAELAPHCDRVVVQLVRLAGVLPALAGRPVAIDLIDSLALNFERRARFDHAALRGLWRLEAARLRRAEARAVTACRAAFLVCERDRRELAARCLGLESRLSVLRLPVAAGAGGAPARAPAIAVFSGNLGYFPNRDAVLDFLRRTWPAVRARAPELRLVVAGARVSPRLRRLLERAGASVLEDPADLRGVVGAATLALAPLRAGSGVALKVLEAWAEGTPVIASAFAAAGADATCGEELLCAESAPQWAEAVGRLLHEDGLGERLRARAAATLRARHEPSLIAEQTYQAVAQLR